MPSTQRRIIALAHAALVIALFILLIATPLYLYISPAWVRYEYGGTASRPRHALAPRSACASPMPT
jgi:hypothetical protein